MAMQKHGHADEPLSNQLNLVGENRISKGAHLYADERPH